MIGGGCVKIDYYLACLTEDGKHVLYGRAGADVTVSHRGHGREGPVNRDAQPALVIGRHYIIERDSAPVQYDGIAVTQPVLVH